MRWCDGGSIKKTDASHLDKVVKMEGSVLGMELDICDRATGAEQALVNYGQSTAPTAQHHLPTEAQLQ